MSKATKATKATEANQANEIISNTEATAQAEAARLIGNAPEFTRIKSVTRPVLKFGAAAEYVRFEGPMYEGEKLKKSKYDDPATLAEVVNLRTGEQMIMICYTVLITELAKHYPNDGYVGKDFEIRKVVAIGKKYALWSITEIQLK